MWPLLLDMTKDESVQSLRCLELEAYACLISTLRAQGSLNQEKLKLLRDAAVILNISQDRHKAEVRRAVNDEKLNTIAYHVSGQKITSDEWALEGRRLVPLMQRVVPQTAYSAIADELADVSSKHNRQLPNPSNTERKRPVSIPSPTGISDINKSPAFRNVENAVKLDDSKKRKMPISFEGTSLSSHIMGPPKMSRIQQIYRQKTKARQKEQTQLKKSENELIQNKVLYQQVSQKTIQKPVMPPTTNINILQNISIPTSLDADDLEGKMDVTDALNTSPSDIENSQSCLEHIPSTSCSKLNQLQNTIKTGTLMSTKKTINTKCITGQKLIVVSNPQSIATTSILQRTLTIPFVKNISVKNLDKFKIVTTNSNSNVQLTNLTSVAPTSGSKHKVVTVRTSPTVKKVIPLSQLQILNAKGGIKVLPIGGKIITKTNSGSTPVYIVNSSNMQCLTKCTSSTPVIMTCKPQGSPDHKSLLVLKNSQVQNPDLSESLEVNEHVEVLKEDEIREENVESVGKIEMDHCKDLDSPLSPPEENMNEKFLTDECTDNIKTELEVQCPNSDEFAYANGLSPTICSTSSV